MKTCPKLATILVALAACLAGGAAQEKDALAEITQRIVAGEQAFLRTMRALNPIVESYIQEFDEDSEAGPVADHYMLGRFRLGDGIRFDPFLLSEGFRREGRFLIFKSDSAGFIPEGFAQMILPDAFEFDSRSYRFEYVRREFLGSVRTLAFNVTPADKKASGKFVGRIWVEDSKFLIVRVNGTYSSAAQSTQFFHFDSWRVEVEPGLWVPAYVYVEDRNPVNRRRRRLKAQTRIWGYAPSQSDKTAELTEILIEADAPIKDTKNDRELSPVERQHLWQRQAETNVIERLERSGLLAPVGDVDGVLNTVAQNLLVSNNLSLDTHCRVLLTTPLETFSIGSAIVISRGLLDVLPDEASLAMALADELAHIVLGHQTETMFAFSDQTMFRDDQILSRLRLKRSPDEQTAASQKALELLAASPYKEELANAGLFLRAIGRHAPHLTSLIEANLGNQLADTGRLLRLDALAQEAPPLEDDKIEQIPALPLGSRVRMDPWTNKIELIEAKPVRLLTPRDKMPFQITPFFIQLERKDDLLSARQPPSSAAQ